MQMIRRFASAVFSMTEVCLPSGSECASEQFFARAMHLRTQTIVPPFVYFICVTFPDQRTHLRGWTPT